MVNTSDQQESVGYGRRERTSVLYKSQDWYLVAKIVNFNEVEWAISSFESMKTPG